MTSPSRCHRWTGRCRTRLLPLPTGCNKAPETLCPRRRSRSETKQLKAATLPASSALYLRRGPRAMLAKADKSGEAHLELCCVLMGRPEAVLAGSS
ncbi:hypothetical protein SORBI_3004G213400 [Sorghum bicolor]|uniref:Uncharacterized protein n=1 Tax=Sorghum bicolor TaxID=4558 RepID=A0A194YQW4_SORBI|nr:hypothetical protein SORBI_3004G213400 [Sorghum bicolor]